MLSGPLARSGDTYVYHSPFSMRPTGEDDRDGKLPRGRHTVEYRPIDAAGNYGAPKSFTATTIAVRLSAGARGGAYEAVEHRGQ
ncbi:hypothetical protein [Nonomuraea sp. NPDC050786]|uniref:hypothetical protein n=1 Tax=Nonomuraea sp. NPDC050786 TaxID=3154840 RepID=UPI0033E89364